MMIRKAAVGRTRCICLLLCGMSLIGCAARSDLPSPLYPTGYTPRPWALHVDRGHFLAWEESGTDPVKPEREDDSRVGPVPMLVTTGWVPIGEIEEFERSHWQTVGTTLIIVMPDADSLKPGTDVSQMLAFCKARGIMCFPVWPALNWGSAELMELILNAGPPHPHDVGVGPDSGSGAAGRPASPARPRPRSIRSGRPSSSAARGARRSALTHPGRTTGSDCAGRPGCSGCRSARARPDRWGRQA